MTILHFTPPANFDGNLVIPSTIVGENVTSIRRFAFSNCTGLKSVTIPRTVTSIEPEAFSGCSNLTGFTVDPANTAFSSNGGVLYSKDGKKLLCCPGEKSGTFNISSSVTSIGDFAFEKCTGLTGISIPSSVTSIGDGAFDGCAGLTSIIIPNSITEIAPMTFFDCSGLTNVSIPDSLTSIYGNAFTYCTGLTSIIIPDKGTLIDGNAFFFCSNLTNVIFKGKVSSISQYTFNNDTTFTVPIGTKAYYENLLTSDVMDSQAAKIVEAAPSPSSTSSSPSPSSSTGSSSSSSSVTIKDSSTGAMVVGDGATNLGSDTTLTVSAVNDTQAIKKASNFLIAAENSNSSLTGAILKAMYQITLNQNGVTIEPNGKVKVTLPLPAELKGLTNYKIVRIGDDGAITPMSTVCDGTNITFETDHFSTYAIVQVPQASAKNTTPAANAATGDNLPILPCVVLAVSAFALFALTMMKKRRSVH